MKLKGIIIAAILFVSAIGVQAQDMFSKLSDNRDVTTVFISKALLQMVPNLDVGGANVGNMMSKLSQLEIYSTEKADIVNMMKKEAERFTKNKTYENLMTVKDAGRNVEFLLKKDPKNANIIKELVMVVGEVNECTIIRMVGDFTMEDIQKIVNDNSKNKKK